MLNRLSVLILLASPFAQAPHAHGQQDPFNPSGYLQDQATERAKRAETLDSRGVYRIDGHRYHQFVSAEGAIYLPGTGSMPEMQEEFVVCHSHLELKKEVLKMRDGLPIDTDAKKVEPQLVALIRKCQEGKVRAPTVTIETRDGAVVELKQKPQGGKSGKTSEPGAIEGRAGKSSD